MPKQAATGERRWYALHTYSGYEDNVMRNLKQRVESLGYEDKIFNVLVPKEKKIKINKNYTFFVTFGYRAPEIQQKYYNDRLKVAKKEHPELSGIELIEFVHTMIAHPDAAGHPTGGALDLTVWDSSKNAALDMGSKISEYGDIAYSLYPKLKPKQKKRKGK